MNYKIIDINMLVNSILSLFFYKAFFCEITYHEYMHYLYETEQTTERFDTMFDDKFKASEFNSASKQLFYELLTMYNYDEKVPFDKFWKTYIKKKKELPAAFYLEKLNIEEDFLKETLKKYYKDFVENKKKYIMSESEFSEYSKQIWEKRKKEAPLIYEIFRTDKDCYYIDDKKLAELRKNFEDKRGMTVQKFLTDVLGLKFGN